eukprot:TRINITY_DN22065_c0_g1_i5.p1 TRINITY_DN22065_c0_g1~~TRINITY_DN22065_c0_g1_i5.p1  ORF type:complete len:473 (+),score=122.65 TRINITY_DN22065_c0_g1_i5:71-1489(+)
MPSLEGLLQEVGIDQEGEEDGELCSPVRRSLCAMREDVEKRTGKLAFLGRYHQPPRVLADDYTLSTAVLGSGVSGAVKLATSVHRPDGGKYAVKQIPLTDISQQELKLMQSEVQTYLCIDHPHICRLVDVYESNKFLSLVMEGMQGGELSDRVVDGGCFAEQEAADTTRQILLAINYLHSHGIVHRDIKHGNVLYDAKGSNWLKLIDFGFSSLQELRSPCKSEPLSPMSPVNTRSPNRKTTRRRIGKMTTLCGTDAFMAPEVGSVVGYTNKVDLWSVGIIVFNLLTGKMPYSAEEAEADLQAQLTNVSADAADFIACLLRSDAQSRLSAADALQHRWLAGSVAAATVNANAVVASLKAFAQMQGVRRCCLLMVAWSLSNEERSKVREYFISMDAGRRGTLQLADLERVASGEDAGDVFSKLASSKQTASAEGEITSLPAFRSGFSGWSATRYRREQTRSFQTLQSLVCDGNV